MFTHGAVKRGLNRTPLMYAVHVRDVTIFRDNKMNICMVYAGQCGTVNLQSHGDKQKT
jgi:hypothetical protein